MTGRSLRLMACGLLFAAIGCGGISEQALRDEQARTRQYRDAYETTAAELAATKARLAAVEKSCSASR